MNACHSQKTVGQTMPVHAYTGDVVSTLSDKELEFSASVAETIKHSHKKCITDYIACSSRSEKSTRVSRSRKWIPAFQQHIYCMHIIIVFDK